MCEGITLGIHGTRVWLAVTSCKEKNVEELILDREKTFIRRVVALLREEVVHYIFCPSQRESASVCI